MPGKDTSVCPRAHVEAATQHLRECHDFLVVGFSALDADVIDLLRVVPGVQKLKVLNGSDEIATIVMRRLAKAHPEFDYPHGASDLGFSAFVDAQLYSFLSSE